MLSISLTSNKMNMLWLSVLSAVMSSLLIKKTSQKILYLHLGSANSLVWEMSILLDSFSILFSFTVLLITYAVFNFSYIYMANQKFFSRFHILLLVFVFSMLLLIFSSNIMLMMLGWDGLGLSSYLLVIYYGSSKAFNAGMLTVMSNRCGDFLLIVCMSLLYSKGSWDFLFYKELVFSSNLFIFILLTGAFTKSAQIPFSAWLPAAMAAPTPVSSLVHSSTLVTAGVYLLFRHLNTMVVSSPSLIIFFAGMSTMILASSSALNEKDMKKMVALSTLSQLGLMVLSLGSGWFFMAFFHLITHAFFKAMMFISVGNMIHFSQDYQSMKNTGSLLYSSPLMSTAIFLASMSLCGAPFTAAFFSKEPIIEMLSVNQISLGSLASLIFSVFLTLVYSSRLIKIVSLQFNSILPATFLMESEYLFNKGVLVLFIPSFISGLCMFSFSMKIPHSFYYPEGLSLVIILLLFSFLSILMKNLFLVAQKGSYYFFSMWGLMYLSSSLFNLTSRTLSQKINSSSFSFYLNIFLKGLLNNKNNLGVFMSTYFIYRGLSTILLMFFLSMVLY